MASKKNKSSAKKEEAKKLEFSWEFAHYNAVPTTISVKCSDVELWQKFTTRLSCGGDGCLYLLDTKIADKKQLEELKAKYNIDLDLRKIVLKLTYRDGNWSRGVTEAQEKKDIKAWKKEESQEQRIQTALGALGLAPKVYSFNVDLDCMKIEKVDKEGLRSFAIYGFLSERKFCTLGQLFQSILEGGQVYEQFQRHAGNSELSKLLELIRMIVRKLKRLHQAGYIHGDLAEHGNNIMFNEDFSDVYFIDFGKSFYLQGLSAHYGRHTGYTHVPLPDDDTYIHRILLGDAKKDVLTLLKANPATAPAAQELERNALALEDVAIIHSHFTYRHSKIYRTYDPASAFKFTPSDIAAIERSAKPLIKAFSRAPTTQEQFALMFDELEQAPFERAVQPGPSYVPSELAQWEEIRLVAMLLHTRPAYLQNVIFRLSGVTLERSSISSWFALQQEKPEVFRLVYNAIFDGESKFNYTLLSTHALAFLNFVRTFTIDESPKSTPQSSQQQQE